MQVTQGQQVLPEPSLGWALPFQRGDDSVPDLTGVACCEPQLRPEKGQPASAAGCPGAASVRGGWRCEGLKQMREPHGVWEEGEPGCGLGRCKGPGARTCLEPRDG